MWYPLLRTVMFRFPAEFSHELGLHGMQLMGNSGLGHALYQPVESNPISLMGLDWRNKVGLAAGLDKNGDCISGLLAMGFGHIEIGTVTPRPQPGNPKPRLFRIPEQQAIINRMGFNNKGIDHLVSQVDRVKDRSGLIGINIGKNFDTPVDNAVDDYLIGLKKAFNSADYITVNISSPNTPGLRTLQYGEELKQLLSALKHQHNQLCSQQRYVPIVVKISPDSGDEELALIVEQLIEHEIDGVIVSNTTLSREGVEQYPLANEAGGLSGKPLLERSTKALRQVSDQAAGRLAIVGVGGVSTAEDAQLKFGAGADLIQIYSGLIYHGQQLVAECSRAAE